MSATDYYETLKARARELRRKKEWTQAHIGLREIKQLCLEEGIEKIDLWPPATCRTAKKRTKVRGIYASNGGRPCVMVNRHLPKEQRVFTLGHELKHHLFDDASDTPLLCETKVENNTVEIGAEIFAAELIYPDADFCRDLHNRDVRAGACSARDLVRLKHDTGTSLSYAALVKKACRFGFARSGALDRSPWKKIEIELFGEPDYLRFRRGR